MVKGYKKAKFMIKLRVTKSFKHEEMSFSFELDGNRVVVFGPSGCGKTTLLKMIVGLLKPDSGEIYINGDCLFSKNRNINKPVYKRKFGYLPQENTLFPNMTVNENILYGLKTQKLPFSKPEFDNIIDRLRIRHKLNSMPARLSGGQMQRVALARVLMIRPKLLLLDEPFSALDTPVRECLRELVTELADEINIPIIFVTHDVEDAFIVGNEIVVIDSGQVIEFGRMEHIYNYPDYVETARLLDYKNIFPISLIKKNEIVLTNEFSLYINDKRMSDDAGFVCIKPENILIAVTVSGRTSKFENRFNGIIKDIHYRGRYVKILFQAATGFFLHIHLSQYEPALPNLKKGEKAQVKLNQDSFVLCKTGLRKIEK
jgi:molybdate transport system ATP-binding protein